jgi:hypothetical protein
MNKGNKKRMEFSKKIFYIVITLFIIVLGYSMALMWKTGITDGLAYLIPSVGTIATTAIGFYYWKAKAENAIKLSKKYDMSLDEIKEAEQKFEEFNTENYVG